MFECSITVSKNDIVDIEKWVSQNPGWILVEGENPEDIILFQRFPEFNIDTFLEKIFNLPFTILRVKCEASLDWKEVPNNALKNTYFEALLGFKVNSVKSEQIKTFIDYRCSNNVNLSRHKFKINPDGTCQQVVIIKSTSAFELGQMINNFKYQLRDEYGLYPVKIQTKYVVYDSKIQEKENG